MRTYKLILFLSLLIYSCNIVSQDDNDWFPSTITNLEDKITKTEKNIRYFVDPQMSIIERNNLIEMTTEYVRQNLMLIKESNFRDSVYIVLVRDKDEMIKYAGGRISGIAMLKDCYIPENMVCCIPKVLKHELMHILVRLKWNSLIKNEVNHPDWLTEGLAVYADPEAENFAGLTLEEMYAYFYQNKKLLALDLLTEFPSVISSDPTQIKIAYSQSGYIVQFLVERYGVQKLKELWIGDSDFEGIYGICLEDMIKKINKELNQKYINPIKFDWEEFSKSYD